MGNDIFIPDSSAIIEGVARELVEDNRLKGDLVVHLLLIRYFRKLALSGKGEGKLGLKEVELLREVSTKSPQVNVVFMSELPDELSSLKTEDDIDFIICELARELNATLITSSIIQRDTASALGVPVIYQRRHIGPELTFEKFFDDETMSIHLKEGVPPYAKKGRPGHWRFVPLRKTPLTRDEIELIVREILEACRTREDSYIDLERARSTILQLGYYRIVITRPPLSDGLEVTAVKPLVKLSIEDYNLPEKLIKRLEEKAEGILIAGAPGMGKTTFAQALAEFYLRRGKVIKTIESPRDLQLPPEVTQYSKSRATSDELHDVLLLSRPDYTVFDEMRTTEDFRLYMDLRLAGVGMIGVVHATSPIDAIQRFVGRVELGMIPSIIDTVIFIRDGKVTKVYELSMVVKIPHGLREADLARPVVIIRDFLTNEPEYEIYVFGERTFVVPIKRRVSALEGKAKRAIKQVLKRYIPQDEFDIEITGGGKALIHVPSEYIAILASSKYRKKLERIGRRLGLEIEVIPH